MFIQVKKAISQVREAGFKLKVVINDGGTNMCSLRARLCKNDPNGLFFEDHHERVGCVKAFFCMIHLSCYIS